MARWPLLDLMIFIRFAFKFQLVLNNLLYSLFKDNDESILLHRNPLLNRLSRTDYSNTVFTVFLTHSFYAFMLFLYLR